MKTLNRYEVRGIAISIIGVVIILGAVRFAPSLLSYWRTGATTGGMNVSDVIFADQNSTNKDGALAQAIIAGSTPEGEVLKLIISDVSVGTGREVRVGDTVTVHYIGVLKGGPEFANSYKKKKPISFQVGAGKVIKGWERGVIGMKEGGKRILVVPASMGYGNTVVEPLPANATLVFSIELVSIE